MQKLRVMALSVSSLVLAISFSATRPAGAEAFEPPEPAGTVRIVSDGLEPERLALPPGQRLTFRNEGATLMRVELDLERGAGIACAARGEEPARGRKFVVATGSALECDAPSGAVAYRVFRSGAPELRGRIEPERPPVR